MSTFGRFGKMTIRKEAKSTNAIQEYNQNRSHGLEIAQIQQNTPKRSWKIGRIMELIKSRDREERAAKVLLQSRHSAEISVSVVSIGM